jgi:hypothetical protein
LTVAVGLLALGTTVTSAVGTPGVRHAGQESVEVIGATAVCPDLRQIPGGATRVSVGSAPLPEGRKATGGSVRAINVVGPPKELALPLQAPGQVATDLASSVDQNALVVSATGALAVGLEVEQVTRGETGAWRGLAGLRCEPPRREAWFVGGATKVDDLSSLVLVNVEDTPATVDVSVFTPKGPADPRLGQGVTVPPHTRVAIPLDSLAPDQGYLAVHVLSRRGRVAMDLRHHRYARPVSLGVDFVPESAPPATSVMVPGFPAGPGGRTLLVANPGADDTTVSVKVTTGDGQFVPTGLAELAVPAGHTVQVSLDAVAATSPLAAQVTSTGAPVLASGIVTDLQDPPVRDFSYTTGTQALSGDALLTDLVIDRPTESTLLLTAPEGSARVVVRPIRVVGTVGALPGPRTITIPAGRTVSFRLSTFYPPGTSTRLAVEVQPTAGSGPVYAARYLRARGAHGPLTTLLVLRGPAQRVSRPAVVQDVEAGYR